jgi:hypothetical protein
MTIILKLKLRTGVRPRQGIGRRLVVIVSHRQHLSGVLDVGHICAQEVNNVTHAPFGDGAF